ncbi:F-box/LRR-repeat protein 2-like [Python bivittatus]|uniref:F-box/LRR-repeat protein 2-like n=1 Tax=Python bivittatus TaxID=176946 RepID=A0A9F5IJ45_PYTBI|nr:F-box/LRR-repeat protein 2-like [Python bivittatus]
MAPSSREDRRPALSLLRLTMALSNDEALINKRLPKELLLRIFSFLDTITLCRCAQISKYWNVLALDGSNWQRTDLFNFQTDVEVVILQFSTVAETAIYIQ